MILTIHIVLGSISVIAGTFALSVKKRRGPHTYSGEIYHALVLGTSASGLYLALSGNPNWGLAGIAIATYAFALAAYIAAKLRRRRWLLLHAPCQLASLFFLVEASVITNWKLLTLGYSIPNGWAWLIPALFFYPAIGIVFFRVKNESMPNSRQRTPRGY